MPAYVPLGVMAVATAVMILLFGLIVALIVCAPLIVVAGGIALDG